MRADAVFRLVTEMSALQKLSLLQLLKLGAASPEVRSVVMDCRDRGLDVDATLAAVLRRFAADACSGGGDLGCRRGRGREGSGRCGRVWRVRRPRLP